MPDNITYVIIQAVDLPLVDFSQLLESSPDTVRYSINNVYVLLKYIGDMPQTISQVSYSGPYTYSEIFDIVQTSEWLKSPRG